MQTFPSVNSPLEAFRISVLNLITGTFHGAGESRSMTVWPRKQYWERLLDTAILSKGMVEEKSVVVTRCFSIYVLQLSRSLA
jgi:hypothetical protein